MSSPFLNRRQFLTALGAGTGALLLSTPSRAAHPAHPNIVFIIADDLGWADIGYHGSEIKTPNLDRLAQDGVRFGHHYVMPTCTPTRVGFMTGHYPSRHGIVAPAYGQVFADNTITLAQALRGAGYHTAISGKWHMGSPPDCLPRKYGFDESYGYFHGQIDPYTHRYKTGEACWHRNDELLEEEGHATDLITGEAIRVLETKREKPLFLYVAYSVPHYPLDEPEEWTAPYAHTIDDPSRRLFAASVTHMDAAIGRIVDAIDRAGLREETLFVFVSDNGGQHNWDSANTKHYDRKFANVPHNTLGNNLPLKGWKGDLYEGGIRVPGFANWPAVLEPALAGAPIHIVDWMPTLCALAGYTPPRDLDWDGQDVWPLVSGKTSNPAPRILYWKAPGQYAVRQGNWKLITDKAGKRAELFDLSQDPNEEKDLAPTHPEQVAQLKEALATFQAKDRDRRTP